MLEQLFSELRAGSDPVFVSPPPQVADYDCNALTPGKLELPSTSKPLVSIVTAVRNGGRTLERMFASVAAQNYPFIEHIVLDGASTDDTLTILNRHLRRVTLWRSARDRGFYDAINLGIAASRGRYVKILNADDELPPDAISHTVEHLESGGGSICVKGLMVLIDDSSRPLGVVGPLDRTAFEHPQFPPLHPTWCVPHAIYRRCGLYRLEFKVASDYEMYHRLLAERVVFRDVPHPLASFRAGGMSSGSRGVFEAFSINRHYLGVARATAISVVYFGKKARLSALRAVVGRERGDRWHAGARRVASRLKRRA